MIPKEITNHISHTFNQEVVSFSHEGGGCINFAGKIVLSNGEQYFVKWNSASLYPGMFEKEAEGLNLLRRENKLKVPEVVAHGVDRDVAFLILEYIQRGYSSPNYWTSLGEGLASLHQVSHQTYGLTFDNFIGSLPQNNEHHDSWSAFFIERRINPLVKKARDRGELSKDFVKNFEKAVPVFESLCVTNESPSLLHGDLWSGNVFASDHELPVLYDPATYYGNREMEMAFTKLFAGFDQRFYDAYEQTYPMEDGHHERVDMYQIYPLLVHVILFGSGYLGSLKSALNRYL